MAVLLCLLGLLLSVHSADVNVKRSGRARAKLDQIGGLGGLGGLSNPLTDDQKIVDKKEPADVQVVNRDCILQWGEWSSCPKCRSKPSDVPKTYRIRSIQFDAAGTGEPCPEELPREEKKCVAPVCDIDCEWVRGDMEEPCPACFEEGKSRPEAIYTIVNTREKQGNGMECPAITRRLCEETPTCPRPCVVSDWDESDKWRCDLCCGENCNYDAWRQVLAYPSQFGEPCPNLREIKACPLNNCTDVCAVGTWSDWSECDEKCDGGIQNRTRTVSGLGCNAPRFEEQECNKEACPKDCLKGQFGPWGQCTIDCIMPGQNDVKGVVRRSRPCRQGVEPGILCNKTDCEEEKACDPEPVECKVDCLVSEWSAWSACSDQCGGGKRQRQRSIIRDSVGLGEMCGELLQEEPCFERPCPQDCKLSEWGDWGQCNAECGNTYRIRRRQVNQYPNYDGKPCGILEQFQACEGLPKCDLACKLTMWADWGKCSSSCRTSGQPTPTQSRERSIAELSPVKSAACGALSEERKCNTQLCPENCVMSEWTEWGECSQKCGGGSRKRSREILSPPRYHAEACPEPLVEQENCNMDACPVDCALTEWSAFGDCSQPCGGGVRYRKRMVSKEPAEGGKACPPATDMVESMVCNGHKCPVNCVVSSFGEWSKCSADCGPAVQTRARVVTTVPLFNGKPCPALKETRVCADNQPCPTQDPFNCTYSWGDFSKCSATCVDLSEKPRKVENKDVCLNENTANPPTDYTLVAKFLDFKKDEPDFPVQVSTKLNGNGLPEVDPAAASGGNANFATWFKLSDRSMQVHKRLTFTKDPDLNAFTFKKASYWPMDHDGFGVQGMDHNYWFTVSLSATFRWTGQGKFSILNYDRSYVFVDGTLMPNPEEVDLTKLGLTTDTVYSLNVFVQTSRKRVSSKFEIATTLVLCAPSDEEYLVCDGQIPCRERHAEVNPYGADLCPRKLTEKRDCNVEECPIDCEVSVWLPWSDCTKECGGGMHTSRREVTVEPANGGKDCPELTKTEACNVEPCPVDCVVGDFGPWTACDKHCTEKPRGSDKPVFGRRTRKREIKVDQVGVGKECPALEEGESCNEHYCPADCVISDYIAEECDARCGVGTRKRVATVLKQPQFGAPPCPELVIVESCEAEQPCPQDCVMSPWGHWTECTKQCTELGGEPGIRTKKRSIVQHSSLGGEYCGVLEQQETCNAQPCPTDCKITKWSSWSECENGVKRRLRHLIELPTFGGKPCPRCLVEKDECPMAPDEHTCEVQPCEEGVV